MKARVKCIGWKIKYNYPHMPGIYAHRWMAEHDCDWCRELDNWEDAYMVAYYHMRYGQCKMRGDIEITPTHVDLIDHTVYPPTWFYYRGT